MAEESVEKREENEKAENELEKMAEDEDWEIRMEVAKKKSLPFRY